MRRHYRYARARHRVWPQRNVPLAKRQCVVIFSCALHPHYRSNAPSDNAYLPTLVVTAIRNILGGTIFRSPIICANIPRLVRSWDHPIVVARHAHADQYRATDALTHPSGGTLTMTFTPADGSPPETREVANLKGAGVSLAMYNTDASITDFAKISFEYAKQHGLPLFLATKNTILKVYDGKFVSKFEEIAAEYPDVEYEHRLIDDFVAGMIKSSGGYGTYCSRIFFVPFGRLAVSHSSNYASLRSLRYPHCRAPSQLSH
jgi:Isocitrate/isopropylmalate dehydrogenase